MAPDRLPLVTPPRSNAQVAQDVVDLVESVKTAEAEISLVEGQNKIVQTRRDPTRIVIGNPAVADIELLTDRPGGRLLNLYGKMFGTTTLTIWDDTNRSVSFLVRVSLEVQDKLRSDQ